MHELSIAHTIVEIIESQIDRKVPLKAIVISIGPLSGISSDALSFCLPIVANDNGFGHPEIRFNVEKIEAKCLDCGILYCLDEIFQKCPQCNSLDRDLLSGDKFTLDSIELMEEGHV